MLSSATNSNIVKKHKDKHIQTKTSVDNKRKDFIEPSRKKMPT